LRLPLASSGQIPLAIDPKHRCIDPGEGHQANARRKSGIVSQRISARKKTLLNQGSNYYAYA
jgi:hypothetical protein